LDWNSGAHGRLVVDHPIERTQAAYDEEVTEGFHDGVVRLVERMARENPRPDDRNHQFDDLETIEPKSSASARQAYAEVVPPNPEVPAGDGRAKARDGRYRYPLEFIAPSERRILDRIASARGEPPAFGVDPRESEEGAWNGERDTVDARNAKRDHDIEKRMSKIGAPKEDVD